MLIIEKKTKRAENSKELMEISIFLAAALTVLAKCHLMMGHWTDAMKSAEIVLSKEKKNVQAILVKAESLYNQCFFEHALVLFHRGRVETPPDSLNHEDFRLGIQKCHKTIGDSVADSGVFQVPGAQILFKLLSTASEMHAEGLQKYQHKKKKNMSFKGLLTKLASTVKVEDILALAKTQGKSDGVQV